MFEQIEFDEKGLVPCVAQDFASGEVLTLAYASEESLRLSVETGELHFYSRSREEIWRKGETSGNLLRLKQLRSTATETRSSRWSSRTGRPATRASAAASSASSSRGETPGTGPVHEALATLERTLRSRAAERPEGSYTVELLDDPELIGAKVGRRLRRSRALRARRATSASPKRRPMSSTT